MSAFWNWETCLPVRKRRPVARSPKLGRSPTSSPWRAVFLWTAQARLRFETTRHVAPGKAVSCHRTPKWGNTAPERRLAAGFGRGSNRLAKAGHRPALRSQSDALRAPPKTAIPWRKGVILLAFVRVLLLKKAVCGGALNSKRTLTAGTVSRGTRRNYYPKASLALCAGFCLRAPPVTRGKMTANHGNPRLGKSG